MWFMQFHEVQHSSLAICSSVSSSLHTMMVLAERTTHSRNPTFIEIAVWLHSLNMRIDSNGLPKRNEWNFRLEGVVYFDRKPFLLIQSGQFYEWNEMVFNIALVSHQTLTHRMLHRAFGIAWIFVWTKSISWITQISDIMIPIVMEWTEREKM